MVNATIPHANITIDMNDTINMSHNESSVVISSRPTQVIKDPEHDDTNRETLLLNRISEEDGVGDTNNSHSIASMANSKQNFASEPEVKMRFDVKTNNNIEKPNTPVVKEQIPTKEIIDKIIRPRELYVMPIENSENNEKVKQAKTARQQPERALEEKRKEKQKQKQKLQQKLKELEQLERMLAEKEMRSKKYRWAAIIIQKWIRGHLGRKKNSQFKKSIAYYRKLRRMLSVAIPKIQK